jgi:hypothetical protein
MRVNVERLLVLLTENESVGGSSVLCDHNVGPLDPLSTICCAFALIENSVGLDASSVFDDPSNLMALSGEPSEDPVDRYLGASSLFWPGMSEVGDDAERSAGVGGYFGGASCCCHCSMRQLVGV